MCTSGEPDAQSLSCESRDTVNSPMTKSCVKRSSDILRLYPHTCAAWLTLDPSPRQRKYSCSQRTDMAPCLKSEINKAVKPWSRNVGLKFPNISKLDAPKPGGQRECAVAVQQPEPSTANDARKLVFSSVRH